VNELELQATWPLQPSATNAWGIGDAAIVGVVGYTAYFFFLLLSMFVVYSIPWLHSSVRFYRLDDVYALVGLVVGISFAVPILIWVVRRRKIPSLADSIYWQCSNRTLGWAFLSGGVFGIAYSVVRSTFAGRGYVSQTPAYILSWVVLAGFAQPIVEEIYFRGILFAALASRLGDIPSIAVVTILFCAVHPPHWFMVLPAAVLLGLVRLYTGSVKACFACHAAYNLSLALFMLPISIHW